MTLWTPDTWLDAWRFAAEAHQRQDQKVPGTDLPYVVHVGAVAMEVASAIARRAEFDAPVSRPDLAIQCALLHDVVEDANVTVDKLAEHFGRPVADGVAALSKDKDIGEKPAQMRDSLARIREQPSEIWMVKLADRITNLQPPPRHWKPDKIRRYRDEALDIHAQLGEACPTLGSRLLVKIEAYSQFTQEE